MTTIQTNLLLAFLCVPLLSLAGTEVNFDSGWRFLKADVLGAEQLGFDDSSWPKLDLPHDSSIEGRFARDLVSFTLEGPGVVAKIDNADNASTELFQASQRRACQGRCVAFVKATTPTGRISVTASAPGLDAGKISLEVSGKSAK